MGADIGNTIHGKNRYYTVCRYEIDMMMKAPYMMFTALPGRRCQPPRSIVGYRRSRHAAVPMMPGRHAVTAFMAARYNAPSLLLRRRCRRFSPPAYELLAAVCCYMSTCRP